MKKHQGDLIIREGDKTDYSQLEEVTGYLEIYSNAKLDNLTSVGGSLEIHSNAKLDNLTSVGGSLYIYSKAKLEAPNLTSVGGSLYIYSNAKLDNLTSVGGSLDIHSNAKLEAPNLTSVGGNLYIYSNAKLDNLTSVGGDLYIYSDAKLDAPFLKGLKYKSVDGYLFIIESERKKGDITILKGYNAKGVKDNVIVKEPCFVAENGDYQSHGQDLKQAIKDLEFKILTDKIKKEPISMEDYITPEKYRMITGACEFGVNSWLKENGITQKRIKVKNILPI